ncbi:MAG: DNA adenine methylase [bacterium]
MASSGLQRARTVLVTKPAPQPNPGGPTSGASRLRYLGNKTRVVRAIMRALGDAPTNGGRFVDIMSGTGAVAQWAAQTGWRVHINDHLSSAVCTSVAGLARESDVPFAVRDGYVQAIQDLNEARPTRRFFAREYSRPLDLSAPGRMYFTRSNAMKIDAIRATIAAWQQLGQITQLEHMVLLSDLMLATNAVANIAGTYGCFMSKWQPNALRPLRLIPRALRADGAPAFSWSRDDADAVATTREDVVYLDPPYTKRQYAAYYHILETLACEDVPVVQGITGLRPWEQRSSDFCYKRKAKVALERLAAGLSAGRLLMSYSNEGHLTESAILDVLSQHGKVTVKRIGAIGRYLSNQDAKKNGETVEELLFDVRMGGRSP